MTEVEPCATLIAPNVRLIEEPSVTVLTTLAPTTERRPAAGRAVSADYNLVNALLNEPQRGVRA